MGLVVMENTLPFQLLRLTLGLVTVQYRPNDETTGGYPLHRKETDVTRVPVEGGAHGGWLA